MFYVFQSFSDGKVSRFQIFFKRFRESLILLVYSAKKYYSCCRIKSWKLIKNATVLAVFPFSPLFAYKKSFLLTVWRNLPSIFRKNPLLISTFILKSGGVQARCDLKCLQPTHKSKNTCCKIYLCCMWHNAWEGREVACASNTQTKERWMYSRKDLSNNRSQRSKM